MISFKDVSVATRRFVKFVKQHSIPVTCLLRDVFRCTEGVMVTVCRVYDPDNEGMIGFEDYLDTMALFKVRVTTCSTPVVGWLMGI